MFLINFVFLSQTRTRAYLLSRIVFKSNITMVLLCLKIILLLKVKIMLSTKELFGINPIHFKKMNYKTVLLVKKRIARDLISNELKKNYLERDYHRIDQLAKAIKNMDKLLSELKENKCTHKKNNKNWLLLLLQSLDLIVKHLVSKITKK